MSGIDKGDNGGFNPVSLVMRLELSSFSVVDIDNVCGNIVSSIRHIGSSYGGPIPLPKQKICNPDGTKTFIHTRIIDLDTDERTAKWLKSFSHPDTVRIKCSVKERKG